MKHLIAALLFLGTFSVQAATLEGRSPQGHVFNYEDSSYLCRTLGDDKVECMDTEAQYYICEYLTPDNGYFHNCIKQ